MWASKKEECDAENLLFAKYYTKVIYRTVKKFCQLITRLSVFIIAIFVRC